MLGRLARYLRILGYDTEYVRGVEDAEILDRLRRDPRVLLTRDRGLARRVPGTVLLHSTALPDQLKEIRAAVPELSAVPRFDRCTACNGPLDPKRPGELRVPGRVPAAVAGSVWECRACGHVYWEGSHTARLRRDLETWLGDRA